MKQVIVFIFLIYAIPCLTHATGLETGKRVTASTSSEDLQVVCEVSETKLYVGQQILYTLQLLYNDRIIEKNYSLPRFQGFSAKKVREQKTEQIIHGGLPYQMLELAYALVPMKTGRLRIEPTTVRCSYVIKKQNIIDLPILGQYIWNQALYKHNQCF